MDVKKELLKIVGTEYDFEFTMNIIKLLIKKDESNRELIEKELSKMIVKKNKKNSENLKKWNSIEYQKGYNLKESSCNGGQLLTSKDDIWLR